MTVYQDLDDPQALPDCTDRQRQSVIARGRSLRRRRRALVVGVPVVTTATAVWVVAALAPAPGPPRTEVLGPAAPAAPEVTQSAPTPAAAPHTGEPRHAECFDEVGDSVGEPDVAFFSLDRPLVPLVHYGVASGTLPEQGDVVLLFEATSADGLRARQLVWRTVDGAVVEQYLLDLRTGARQDVPRTADGASFPRGALSGLGEGWTWTASLSVDGTVVDACDRG